MPGWPLQQKWGIFFFTCLSELSALARERTHQPPVINPTPSCRQHSPYLFVCRTKSGRASGLHLPRTAYYLQLTQSGFPGTLTLLPVALSWSLSIPLPAVLINEHHSEPHLSSMDFPASERCGCVHSASFRKKRGNTRHRATKRAAPGHKLEQGS